MKKPTPPNDPAKITAMLRTGALAIGPAEIGYSPDDCPKVWGVMMELGNPDVVVSLVALLDGSVSIYLSDGDGVIGCGRHPDVRIAARKMLQVADRLQQQCRPVGQYPLPGERQVNFYMLSHQGVLGAAVDRFELDEGAIELAELYYAGHSLISIVELLGAGVDLVDEIHLAETARVRRLQLAEHQSDGSDNTDMQVEMKQRGRGCRILPYAGGAVRRLQH